MNMDAEAFERAIFFRRVELLACHFPLRAIERSLEPLYTVLEIMREGEARDKETGGNGHVPIVALG